MTKYKSLTVLMPDTDFEKQIYVVEDSVTLEQLTDGDDSGVVCLMLDESQTDNVVSWLNQQEGGHV